MPGSDRSIDRTRLFAARSAHDANVPSGCRMDRRFRQPRPLTSAGRDVTSSSQLTLEFGYAGLLLEGATNAPQMLAKCVCRVESASSQILVKVKLFAQRLTALDVLGLSSLYLCDFLGCCNSCLDMMTWNE